MVVAVGSGERIGMLLPELAGLFRRPLMTVAADWLAGSDGQLVSRPDTLPGTDAAADPPAGTVRRVKLTACTSAAARRDGRAAYRAISRGLRAAGVSGATSVRGIWGFHGDRAPHGGQFGHHVPVVTTVIDEPERIAAALGVIDGLTTGRGLVTAEAVLVPRPAGVSSGRGS